MFWRMANAKQETSHSSEQNRRLVLLPDGFREIECLEVA
jgi:hypothetical protein